MPTGQVSATVSARRLIVQEGGLYNGEFRMIQETQREEMKGLSSWQELAGKEPDGSALDDLNSDEWWRKFSASQPEIEPGGALTDSDGAGEQRGAASGLDGPAGA